MCMTIIFFGVPPPPVPRRFPFSVSVKSKIKMRRVLNQWCFWLAGSAGLAPVRGWTLLFAN